MRGRLRNVSVMPAKAGIQTWPHVPGPWIPAYAGMTQRSGRGLADFPLNRAGATAPDNPARPSDGWDRRDGGGALAARGARARWRPGLRAAGPRSRRAGRWGPVLADRRPADRAVRAVPSSPY